MTTTMITIAGEITHTDHAENMITELNYLLANILSPMIYYHGPESQTLEELRTYGKATKTAVIHCQENRTRTRKQITGSEYSILINPTDFHHKIIQERRTYNYLAGRTAVIFSRATAPQTPEKATITPYKKRAGKQSRRSRRPHTRARMSQ